MKKSWWKVPVYCMAASWICFQLRSYLVRKWAIVTSLGGSVSIDFTRWLLLSAALSLAVVCVGGFVFFRKMTRREIFCSAYVLVVLNVICGLLAYKLQKVYISFTVLWSVLTEWDSVISQLLFRLGLNEWLSAAITWLLPPYIFVLFGTRGTIMGEKAE